MAETVNLTAQSSDDHETLSRRERAALAVALWFGSEAARIMHEAGLRTEHFAIKPNVVVWQAVEAILERGGIVDEEAIRDELKRAGTIVELGDDPRAHLAWLAEEVDQRKLLLTRADEYARRVIRLARKRQRLTETRARHVAELAALEAELDTEPEVPGVLLADGKPREVSWLWPGYIPRGYLTLLDGDPGVGKSHLTLDIAARVTRGLAMPDGSRGLLEPAGVVLITTEDEPWETVMPRLLAAGGDPSKVRVIQEIGKGESAHDPVLPGDLDAIERAIRATDATFVVFDPLVDYLGTADVNKMQDVRRVLRLVDQLARRLDVAVIGVRHLNKQIALPAIHRGTGSTGVMGRARAGLLVGKHPEDPQLRVLAPTKTSLAEWEVPSLAWRRVWVVVRYDADTVLPRVGRIVWQGRVDLTADQVQAPAVTSTSDRAPGRPARDRAATEERLREILADGPRWCDPVIKQVQDELRVSLPTIYRAKAELGVESWQEPGPDGTPRRMWGLPGSRRPSDRLAVGAMGGSAPPDPPHSQNYSENPNSILKFSNSQNAPRADPAPQGTPAPGRDGPDGQVASGGGDPHHEVANGLAASSQGDIQAPTAPSPSIAPSAPAPQRPSEPRQEAPTPATAEPNDAAAQDGQADIVCLHPQEHQQADLVLCEDNLWHCVACLEDLEGRP